jgi:2-keto-3-deoxy-L-fuconate dehydrogenase
MRRNQNWTSGQTNSECHAKPVRHIRQNPGAQNNTEHKETAVRLKGKTALVTAAGQGIGRAAVMAMAAEGAQVWATDVNPKLLDSYDGVQNVRAVTLDVLDKAAIGKLITSIPKLDVLFNCAGFVHNGSILDATDADWDFAFNLNVRAQYWAIQAALPGMLAHGGGSIINMASVCSSLKGLPNRFIYGTSKAAVVGLTKSVAADFVAKGIRCNAIAPGTVDTPSLGDRINSYADPAEARRNFIARQPMGRLAQAHEIAPIIVYLASDESVFATGQVFSVDGGMMI